MIFVQVTGLEGVVESLQVNNDRLTVQVDQNLTSIQSLQQQINILKVDIQMDVEIDCWIDR